MKIRSNYTLYWRVVPSGKRAVYYYAWDENNKRRGGCSTGQTAITAAKLHCDKLLREGKLIPNSDFMPTFAEYAQGWRGETCACLKKRRKRASLTQAYADNNRKNLKNLSPPLLWRYAPQQNHQR